MVKKAKQSINRFLVCIVYKLLDSKSIFGLFMFPTNYHENMDNYHKRTGIYFDN